MYLVGCVVVFGGEGFGVVVWCGCFDGLDVGVYQCWWLGGLGYFDEFL